ncbi:MAG: hypothetical protein GY839_16850 [candidate division Zixibacteria bacterium]|nr:hypothetical protein [candidate division Zixibacteria bacterium]
MLKILSIVLISFISFLPTYADTIAVLDLDNAGVSAEVSEAVTAFIENGVVNYSDFKIVSRNQILKVLEEQKFQLTGATENTVEAGKLLSVDQIITGKLFKLGSEFTLLLELIDVETGEIVKSEKKSARIQIEDIDNVLVEPIVESLFSKRRYKGFTIVIKSITGLPKLDTMSKTDPWVSIHVGNTFVGQTQKYQDNNSPVINERFEVKEYYGESIILRIYDRDVKYDDPIGQATLRKPESGKYQIIGMRQGFKISMGQIEVFFE